MAEPIETTEAVVELQMQIAFQDRLIADLDEVVRAFASRVEVLERAVKALQTRLDEQGEAGLPPGPHDERPPHY